MSSIQSLNGYPAQTPTPASTSRENPAALAAEVVAKTTVSDTQKSAQVSQKQVEQAFEQIKTAFSAKANSLQFSMDDQTGETIVRVVDIETGDIIRQIPSKELVEIAKALDKMQGMLLKQKA